MKSNLLTPQAFLQYKLLESLSRTNAKNQTETELPQSSFGGERGLQAIVAMAKLSGAYAPSCVISKIKNPSGHGKEYRLDRDFLNIENHKLSLLVPEIRLYRVEGKKYKPFYFPVTTDYNFTSNGQYDKSRAFSANAATLKSFNIDYVGNSPFEAGLGMLETSLEVELDSLSTLFSRPNDSFAELADLILMRVPESKRLPDSGKTPEVGALQSGRALEIAATLGYSFLDGDNIFTAGEKKAIEATKLLVTMHYKGKSISIQQNGAVTISAQYHGSLKAVNKDFIYNVVEKVETKKKLLGIRTDAKPSAGKKDALDIRKGVPSEKKKLDSTAAENSALEKPDYMLSIVSEISKVMNKLHLKGKIYEVRLNQDLARFRKSGTVATTAAAPSTSAPPSTAGQTQDNILTGDYVFYVNFGDLLDAFMDKIACQDFDGIKTSIKTDRTAKKILPEQEQRMLKSLQESQRFLRLTNVFFGDISIQPKGKSGERVVNISDIPISIDLIYTAIYEDYVKPRKYFFGLKEFLVSFCAGLLNDALTEYSGSDIMKKAKVKVSTVLGADLSAAIKKGKGTISIKKLDTETAKLTASAEKEKSQYVIYHQERCETSGAIGRGHQKEDQDNGIIHLRTSQDRGLVKGISFSAMNVPGLEEYLIVGHGNAYDVLRTPHNATVTMFGNTLFHPLMTVYIDPESLGLGEPAALDSATRKLGIGGYYTVIKVTTAFASGTLNTTLQLQFAGYPETIGEPKRSPGATKADKEVEDIMQRSKSLNKN